MTWVKLDDNWCDSPQVFEAGPEAAWLHVCALSWSNRQLADGRVPRSMLRRLVPLADPEAAAERLVHVGMWKPTEDGWQIIDCLEHQPSREKVLEIRGKRKAAGKQGGLVSGVRRRRKRAAEVEAAAGGSTDEAPPEQVASSVLEPPARRDGTPSRPTALRAGAAGRKRKPVDNGKLPRDPRVADAESVIDRLEERRKSLLRTRAIQDLGDALPRGWERDEGQPWEQTIYGRMVRLTIRDRESERRTGT